MHIVHVSIDVKPEAVDAFIEATIVNARESLRESGVARFDFIQVTDDPAKFMLVEVYRTPEDVDKHKQTQHYARWAERVTPMLREPRTRIFYRNIYPDDTGWDSIPD